MCSLGHRENSEEIKKKKKIPTQINTWKPASNIACTFTHENNQSSQ